jgi:hypothetical protein
MRHTGSTIDVDHALGLVGLFLMLVVARTAGPAFAEHPTPFHRAIGFASRRAIDIVAVIGWLFDRLPARVTESGRRAPASGGTTAATWG